MKKLFSKSRGQIIVMYAAAIGGLLAAVALGTDVAVMYVNWQQVQKAADAGALAGADQFSPKAPAFNNSAPGCPNSPATNAAACTFAVNNSATVAETTVTVPAPTVPASVPAQYASQTVQVTVNRTDIPVIFGRAMGLTTPYQATATAIAVGPLPLGGAKNPFPAGLPATPNNLALQYGQVISITNPNGNWSSGDWGWLNLGGGGANGLANNITSGCSCTLKVNDQVSPETGENWGQVQTAVSALNPTGALPPANLTGNEPELVTVPIVNWTGATGASTPVTVLGFAEMWVIGISKSGSGQSLQLEFLQYVPKLGQGGGGPNDYGAYSKPALVE